MTSLLDGARRLVTRSADIGARIEGLDAAVTVARGRLDDGLVDDAALVVERATARAALRSPSRLGWCVASSTGVDTQRTTASSGVSGKVAATCSRSSSSSRNVAGEKKRTWSPRGSKCAAKRRRLSASASSRPHVSVTTGDGSRCSAW